MQKSKILIVSRAFYPVIAPRAFRATELAKEFARQNHDVTVLTHTRGHDFRSFENRYNLQVKDFTNNQWREIKIRGNKFEVLVRKAIRSFLVYLFQFPDIQLTIFLRKYLKNFKGYDLLISIAAPYPVHWGVALARQENKSLAKIWIADCGDPFWKNKEKKFTIPFYFKIIENWFCNKPDFITVPIPEAKMAYPRKCQRKIYVIPQGFKFDEFPLVKEGYKNAVPTFAFAGTIKKGVRNPNVLLDFLSTIKMDFRFIIYTRKSSIILPYKEILGSKLEIKDYIPRNELLVELAKMDFLVNLENNKNYQSPSKLIDYALLQKPILSINNKNFNKEVVNSFLKGDYGKSLKVENIEQYDIKNVVIKFINLGISGSL